MSETSHMRRRHGIIGVGLALAAVVAFAGGGPNDSAAGAPTDAVDARPAVAIAGLAAHHSPSAERTAMSGSIVEIRSYNLRPGARPEFHRLISEEAAPMVRRWGMDLVAYGPSPHDETSYYAIRAFEDLDDRQRREDAFYDSDEWRDGPREAILSLIESYTTVVLELDRATLDGLRASGGGGTADRAALEPSADGR